MVVKRGQLLVTILMVQTLCEFSTVRVDRAVFGSSAILQKYLTFQGGFFMFSWVKTAQNRCFSTLQLLNLINIKVRKGQFWVLNILFWVKIG